MKLRSIPAFVLLLGGLATGALGEAPAPSRLDDLVERFVAIVERDAPDEVEPWTPPAFREDMLRLNPGREQQVDEFVGRVADCHRQVMADAMPRAARASARALGEERLAALVAFLEGPGGEARERSGRGDRSHVSASREEESDRFRRDYGMFMYAIPNHVDPDSRSCMTRCPEEEAARLRLRME